jgi:adenosylmethionine-8-amino-7-oxononanoate aminotransferase
MVGDVRGKGLMMAVEFVKDRATKAPFPRAEKFAERFTEKAFQNGLVLWPNVGNADGTNGDLIMISPPFTVTREEISEMVTLLKKTLEQMK